MKHSSAASSHVIDEFVSFYAHGLVYLNRTQKCTERLRFISVKTIRQKQP